MSSHDIKTDLDSDIKKDVIELISSRNSIKKTENSSISIDPNLIDSSNQDHNIQDISYHNELVYGSSIDVPKPTKLGAVKAFLYFKGNPLIIIGPDCKLYYLLLIF